MKCTYKRALSNVELIVIIIINVLKIWVKKNLFSKPKENWAQYLIRFVTLSNTSTGSEKWTKNENPLHFPKCLAFEDRSVWNHLLNVLIFHQRKQRGATDCKESVEMLFLLFFTMAILWKVKNCFFLFFFFTLRFLKDFYCSTVLNVEAPPDTWSRNSLFPLSLPYRMILVKGDGL